MSESPSFQKERMGVVLSNKMQKTIVVQVRRRAVHPEYRKVVNHAAKFKVHDEKNQARPGDTVRIVETRPISKEKRWRLVEIVKRAGSQAASELKEGV